MPGVEMVSFKVCFLLLFILLYLVLFLLLLLLFFLLLFFLLFLFIFLLLLFFLLFLFIFILLVLLSGVSSTSAARGDDLKCRPFRKIILISAGQKMPTQPEKFLTTFLLFFVLFFRH